MRYSLNGNILTRGEGSKAKSMTLTSIQSAADAKAVMDGIRKWNAGALIQNAMPLLNNDEREFIMTGHSKTSSSWICITAEEWKKMFGSDEQEE